MYVLKKKKKKKSGPLMDRFREWELGKHQE